VLGVLLLVTLTAAPAAGVAWAGTAAGLTWLTWLAVPVGLGTGAAVAIWGAHAAEQRLHAAGPELLTAMRSGTPVPISAARRPDGAAPAPAMPGGLQALVTFLWVACWIPLFPQGVLPLWMIATGSDNRLWFLALHVADPWRVPIAVAFVALGLAMLTAGTIIPRRHARRGTALREEETPAAERPQVPVG
jgi:ABC-2 type transport system permease protein